MLYSTEQIEKGVVDITKVDLDKYAHKVNVPTNEEFDDLTATVANKLDRTPMHHHQISDIERLQQSLDDLNNDIISNKNTIDDILKNHYDAINLLAGVHGLTDDNEYDGNKFTTSNNPSTPSPTPGCNDKADKIHKHDITDINDVDTYETHKSSLFISFSDDNMSLIITPNDEIPNAVISSGQFICESLLQPSQQSSQIKITIERNMGHITRIER